MKKLLSTVLALTLTFPALAQTPPDPAVSFAQRPITPSGLITYLQTLNASTAASIGALQTQVSTIGASVGDASKLTGILSGATVPYSNVINPPAIPVVSTLGVSGNLADATGTLAKARLPSLSITDLSLSLSGATSKVATVAGVPVNGNCVTWNSGSVGDAGAPCGTSSGGSGTVTGGNTGQVAGYSANGTTVSPFSLQGLQIVSGALAPIYGTAANTSLQGNGTALPATYVTSALTSVGTLTSGKTGSGFTVDLANSTLSGALPLANSPAYTGDVTKAAGSGAVTVNQIGGSATTIPTTFVNSSLKSLGTLTNLNTNYSGNSQSVFETINPTGVQSGPAGNVSHVINVVNDNIDTGSAYQVDFGVQDLSFGGSAAGGGRQVITASLTQTAPTKSTNPITDYIALTGNVLVSSGDGGTPGATKGNYYALYAPMIFGSGATNTSSYNGAEFDINMVAGSSTLFKTGVHIGHSTLGGNVDSVKGSVDDNLLWLDGQSAGVGSKYGIQYGRADFSGQDYGVDHNTGSLIGTDGNAGVTQGSGSYNAGYGINLTGAVFKYYAWLAYGSSIDGSGNSKFNSVTSNSSFSINPAGTQLLGIINQSNNIIYNANQSGAVHYFEVAGAVSVAIDVNGIIVANAPTSAPSGTTAGSACFDSAGRVYKKTTTGPCL